MSDVGYIAAAWSIAAAVLVGYVVRVALRTRHAERSLADDDPRR
jgi:hypothetical protein